MSKHVQESMASFQTKVVKKERLLLYLTGFALDPELPFEMLEAMVQNMLQQRVANRDTLQSVQTIAWALLNDRWCCASHASGRCAWFMTCV